MANVIGKLLNPVNREIKVEKGLAGKLQSGFKFRLYHMIYSFIWKLFQLVKGVGPGHHMQIWV